MSSAVNKKNALNDSTHEFSVARNSPDNAICKDFSQEERSVISALEKTASNLGTSKNISKVQAASNVKEVLRQLLRVELGSEFEPNAVKRLFAELWEYGPIVELFRELYELSEQICSSCASNFRHFSSESASKDLKEILKWYVSRKKSIYFLKENIEDESDNDCLSNIRVYHDQSYLGVKGLEIVSTLKLVARASRNFWLKASITYKDKPVRARPDWRFWVDETDTYVISGRTFGEEFASLVPIAPIAQRTLLDNVSIFIPYDALDLIPGKHAVCINLTLADQAGQLLLSDSLEEFISIVGPDMRAEPVPSPQALGMWAKDEVTGDHVSIVQISESTRTINSKLEQVIVVRYDLALFNHLDERIGIECRLLRSDGEILSNTSGGLFLLNRNLSPSGNIERHNRAEFIIPKRSLDLDRGKHNLRAEISIVDDESKLLCGVLKNFNVEISHGPDDAELIKGSHSSVFTQNEVSVEKFELKSNFLFGSHSILRVLAKIRTSKQFENPYCVVVELLDLNGNPLAGSNNVEFLQSVWISPLSEEDYKDVIFNFPNYWFQKIDKTELLLVKLKVIDKDDNKLYEISRKIKLPVAGLTDELASSMLFGGVAKIIDLRSNVALPSTGALPISITIQHIIEEQGAYTLYYELVDDEGQPVLSNQNQNGLSGTVVRIDANELQADLIGCSGWIQSTIDVDCRFPENFDKTLRIKFMLFSESGKLLQLLFLPLSPLKEAVKKQLELPHVMSIEKQVEYKRRNTSIDPIKLPYRRRLVRWGKWWDRKVGE